MAQLENAYKFTIQAGIVTAVFEYDDGAWKQQSIDDGETYTLDPNDANVVIKSETDDGVTKTERFITSDGGQTYYQDETDDGGGTGGSGGDLYRFTFDGADNITAVYEFDDGSWKQLRLDGNETYTVDANLGRARVIKTEYDDGVAKTEVFEDSNADGDYTEVGSSQSSSRFIYIGSGSADMSNGGAWDDELYGNGGDDDLSGDDGDDDMFGDDGNDSLRGGTGTDELYGGLGNDRLLGGGGNDDCSGDGGTDDLNGGEGSDELRGGGGADTLTGGIGQDRLAGGLGADAFVFSSKLESTAGVTRDVIVDFSSSQGDRLNLVAIDANEKLRGNQMFTWLGSRGFSGQAGQLRAVTDSTAGGIVVQGDINGDRVADFEISLAGIGTLSSSQILL